MYDEQEVVASDFVAFDNKIVYSAYEGIMCRSAEDGELLWTWKHPAGQYFYVNGTISLDENYIFLPLTYGTVCCLDRDTGELVWEQDGSLEFFSNSKVEFDGWVRKAQQVVIVDQKWVIHAFENLLNAIIVYDYHTGRKLLGIENHNMQGLPLNHLFFKDDVLYVVESAGLRAYRIYE